MKVSTLICALLLAAPLALFAPRAAAQQSQQHAEECTTYGFLTDINYNYGVINTCGYAVEVWFMSSAGREVSGQIARGQVLDTGIPLADQEASNWAAAICRAGYRPSIPLNQQNFDAIQSSRYTCVRAR